jgi:hypothetical protein
MAFEAVVRMPKMARGGITLERGIHCCPIFKFMFNISAPFFKFTETCMYTHMSDFVKIVYELPLLPYNTASETFLYRSEAGQSALRVKFS